MKLSPVSSVSFGKRLKKVSIFTLANHNSPGYKRLMADYQKQLKREQTKEKIVAGIVDVASKIKNACSKIFKK